MADIGHLTISISQMQQRHHKKERLEEATLDILYEIQYENTMLSELKRVSVGH